MKKGAVGQSDADRVDRARFTVTALLIGGLLSITLLLAAFYLTRRATWSPEGEGGYAGR